MEGSWWFWNENGLSGRAAVLVILLAFAETTVTDVLVDILSTEVLFCP